MATILDSLVGSCANKLQDIITEEAILILGVKEDLKELQRTMNHIQCFLNDAEQRRTKESAVNNWLGELKDAMYVAEDIIDLARLEGNKLLADRPSSSRNSASFTDFSFCSCLPNIRRRHEIAIQIRNFNTELEKISKLGERFLKLQNMQPQEEVSAVQRMKTCQLMEPNLVGKETSLASRRLVELILAHKETKAYKIGIVGTGGVGKTTLAQKVYNDNKIKGTFSKQAWICVSQEYSEVALLKELLRKIGLDYKQDETVGELSRKLAIAVEKKSFFLVLDDIWQHEVWTNLLRRPLGFAATGIILVTTRNDTVARAIGAEDVHRVELMSTDVGWELLWKSMNVDDESEVQNLQGIGMEIVRMCGGLPLAIKVIASVLATKEKTENQWTKVMNKSAWSMTKLPVELRGALYLSYDELPRCLKQCFLYCALYPEDFNMHRDDLINYWIAQGFVEAQEELLEDTAEEYYYELIYRNLLQPDPSDFNLSVCRMHDLLRQLAQNLSQDSFCGEAQLLDAKSLSKLRHISIVTDKDSIMLPSLDKEHLRASTLLIRCDKSPRVENTIFKRLPKIRVLDLTGSIIQNVPNCIGNLIHLRSLDLDDTDISYLPESICRLINLQRLNLERCDALHSLPSGITQLCNLRRLGLNRTPINHVPKEIGRLKFLNTLRGFPVGGVNENNNRMQDGWNLKELEPLLQLRRVSMTKLERASLCCTDSPLLDKKNLKALSLCFTGHRDEPYYEESVTKIEKILEQLIPPQNMEDLDIKRFFGQRFPSWLGTAIHLSSLKCLQLKYCKSCGQLPPIGQLPNLKYLRIKGATAITKIGPEFVGCGVGISGSTKAVAFPKLESLVIEDMLNWEEWTFVTVVEEEAKEADKDGVEDGADAKQVGETTPPRMRMLPHLKELQLDNCPRLRALPRQLGQEATSLKELELRGMDNLKVVDNLALLSETLLIVSCVDLEKVSNVPQVTELRVQGCPNLRYVEKLDNLQQLWLDEDMQEISSLWVPELQKQHRQLHGEDLDVYNWTEE